MSKQRRILAPLLGALAVVAAVLVPVGPSEAAPTGDMGTWTSATVPLPAGGIAYDASRDRVLVAVRSTVPGLGNRLVEIDPHTGARGRAVFVGSEPSAVAVADDGSRAYVGLRGSPVVVEVDLASFTVTRTFPLGTESRGIALTANDIEVQPGSPTTIAVSLQREPREQRYHERVAVFDEGVPRPVVLNTPARPTRLAWGDDPAELYGYNDEISGFDLYRLTVDAQGVTQAATARQRINGWGTDIVYADGLLHGTDGTVADPSTMEVVGSYGTSGPLVVDVAQDRTFVLAGDQLHRHETSTRSLEGSLTVPDIDARRMVGAGDVLVAASSSALLLIGPGVTAAGFVPPAAPPSMIRSWATTTVDLAASEVAASPDGETLYAVVGSSAPAHADEVVEVDVATGAIGRSLFVGADPHRLAVSDDGSTLMVGRRATAELTEVDVATFTVRRFIPLGGIWPAQDIAPRPGTADSFAVVIHPEGSAVARESVLVEGGVVAAERVAYRTGPTSITFAGDPDRLYGHNGGSTEFGFSTVEVGPDGLALLGTVQRVLAGFALEVVHADGLVYGSDGGVVDPTGPFRVATFHTEGQAVPVPALDRVFHLFGDTIHENGLGTYSAVGKTTLGEGDAVDATLAGETLAVATSAGTIALIPLGPDERVAPGAPTAVTAVPGDRWAWVSWTAPADEGVDAPVELYTVTADPGGATCTAVTSTTCGLGALENGTAYTFTVVASNVKGSGPPSAPSEPVTPFGPPPAPGAPTAVAGDGEVSLSWAPPPPDGGDPVNAYVATAQPSGASCATTAIEATSCTIEGLTNGIPHTFTVRALNIRGPGPASLPSHAVVPTACGGPGAGPFPDVGAAHRFCAEVEWLVGREITGGYPDGGFHPTAGLSRQAIAAFLHRYAGRPPVWAPVFPSFVDVSPGHAFYSEIEWLAAEGLANGYADGTFRPTSGVTRQSLAAMLHRLAGSPSVPLPGTPTFSDVPASHPFRTEIEWLAGTGISAGYDDGTFRPGEPISRQAMAAFLHRFSVLPVDAG